MKFFQRTPVLDNSDHELLRATILQYFQATYDRYELLFETLTSDESYYKKPISLRHPLIFYLGHTATFYINKLILAGLIEKRVNPEFESLFAVGVDEMGWDDIRDQSYPWPSVQAVKEYRSRVRMIVQQLISHLPLNSSINWQHSWWPIVMGIEHERIHLETSSVLIRQQDLHLVRSHPAWKPCEQYDSAPVNKMIKINAGDVQLNKQINDPYYGWDNEYGTHTAHVPVFEVSQYLVSNQEFLEFVEKGGYHENSFWQAEGLAWRKFSNAQYPTFWRQKNNQWFLRLMTEEIAMPWSWPVEINYHEAKAFCQWKTESLEKTVRLPTEDEWYRLYDVCKIQQAAESVESSTEANIHLNYFASSCPVSLFPQGNLFDVVGNVWQWTETPIYPFCGFEAHPLYDDFTTPTFDGKHNLIKGGSWISTGNEALASARYAFRRHFFQHAGFRYVITDTPVNNDNIFYETDQQLSEYAEFHYGDEYYGVSNYPKSLIQLAMQNLQDKPRLKALDLGCATGRASFELSQYFDEVTGIDFSARFINLCIQMRDQGIVRYSLIEEGQLVSYKTRSLTGLNLEKKLSKIEFFQNDACNLATQFTNYDFILAANLIDRLYQPADFLAHIHERLNIGGVLMITSPYTWLETHTRPEHWLGGFKKDGENVTTLDTMKMILAKHFRLINQPKDVPFVIRETRRKFQHSIAEVTLWERIT
ncbi:MAG: 5-histidylcysteine sulfoxide synthase [Pseudomonadota bacterium]